MLLGMCSSLSLEFPSCCPNTNLLSHFPDSWKSFCLHAPLLRSDSRGSASPSAGCSPLPGAMFSWFPGSQDLYVCTSLGSVANLRVGFEAFPGRPQACGCRLVTLLLSCTLPGCRDGVSRDPLPNSAFERLFQISTSPVTVGLGYVA